MAPNARAMDARSPSQLRKLLEEGRYDSADDSIRTACESVKRWLACNQDNLRDFFKECYLPLMDGVLGLRRTAWLTLVDTRPEQCAALLELLKPDGQLFRAMVELDAEGFNQYQLPCTMLAPHTQALLTSAAGVAELQKWPQYREALAPLARQLGEGAARAGRLPGPQAPSGRPPVALPPPFITLPLSTSFLMLLAHSALRLGTPSRAQSAASGHHLPRFATNSLSRFNQMMHPGAASSRRGASPHHHPYFRLLRLYIRHLLPQPKAPGPARAPALPRQAALGVVLLASMLETWLTDLDIPTPGQGPGELLLGMSTTLQAFGRSGASPPPSAAPRAAPFAPQNAYQVKAVQELVSHLLLREPEPAAAVKRGVSPPPPPPPQPAHTAAPWLPRESVLVSTAVAGFPTLPVIAGGQGKAGLCTLLGPSADPALQNVSAHIYRYLRRSFALWPLGQQREGLSALRELLLQVCMPWKVAGGNGARYSKAWQQHVLAHLPFYLILVPEFLGLVLSYVDFAAEAALAEALAVAQAFQSETELLELLGEVEVAAVRAHAGLPLPSSSKVGLDMRPLVGALAVQAGALERCAVAGVRRGGAAVGGAGADALQPDASFRLFLKEDIVGDAPREARPGGPGRAADIVAALQGQAPDDKLQQLRDAFKFLDVDRFSSSAAGRRTIAPSYQVTCRMLAWGGPARTPPERVPFNGEWLYRPVAHNECRALVPALAAASAFINRALGFGDDEALGRRHAALQRAVKFCKAHGVGLIDLRPAFQTESVVFWCVVAVTGYYILYLFGWLLSLLTVAAI